ncbi:30S ribosome-binding factor RbfA [Allorhodopirellula heiligendammensis]|uniref:Ribosome-binding factor A n=1 Tax=Allorhodopirellula heiligendammensis TaxID=2714739 RepID=A0A5C6C561_9BACT|nr:30S ribosome-binding factor RbfA [Allorhodopirellula heiligendammensis]TWU18464.1 Ribosome-binding factor A [Allorhodopirellula heiligendammensis]
MSTRRQLKAAEAIREVVATSVLTDIRDPRVRDVTVISVDVSPDMREAKVSVSVMGDDAQKDLSIRGLQNSAGFLQSKIANRLDTRYTPRLTFELNRGQENALAVHEILARLKAEKEGSPEGEGGGVSTSHSTEDEPTASTDDTDALPPKSTDEPSAEL